MPHPMQPIGLDGYDGNEHNPGGTARFKQNAIVRSLLDMGPYDLNKLTIMVAHGLFREEDYVQLMQLIGYSVCGFGELSSSPPEMVQRADAIVEGLL